MISGYLNSGLVLSGFVNTGLVITGLVVLRFVITGLVIFVYVRFRITGRRVAGAGITGETRFGKIWKVLKKFS